MTQMEDDDILRGRYGKQREDTKDDTSNNTSNNANNKSAKSKKKTKKKLKSNDNSARIADFIDKLSTELSNYKTTTGDKTNQIYIESVRKLMTSIPNRTPAPLFLIYIEHLSDSLKKELVNFKKICTPLEFKKIIISAAGKLFEAEDPATYGSLIYYYLGVEITTDQKPDEKSDSYLLLGVYSYDNDNERKEANYAGLDLYEPEIREIAFEFSRLCDKDSSDDLESLISYLYSNGIAVKKTERIVKHIYDGKDDLVRQIYLKASKGEGLPEINLPKEFTNTVTRIIKRHNILSKELGDLPDDILNELFKHTFEVISEKPLSFVIARSDTKKIVQAVIVQVRAKGGDRGDGWPELEYNDTIIKAIPTKIIRYENPSSPNIKYEMELETNQGEKFKTDPFSLEQLAGHLKTMGLVYKPRVLDETLAQILQGYKLNGKIIVKNEVDTEGFYLVDGKITPVKVDIQVPTRDKIIRCTEVLDHLSTKLKHTDRFATYIKWGIASPFSFIMKQLDDEQFWLQLLFLDGFTRCGKTTDGEIILAIWRKHTHKHRRRHNIGFASIDTVYKLGEALNYGTFPILVNEVELSNLRDPKTKAYVEVLKHALQNETVRRRGGKKGTVMEYFSALASVIFTSNDNPPDDPAFMGRIIRTHYTSRDKPTEQEKAEFDKYLFKDHNIDELGTLGDFAASYLLEHQELIHEEWKFWTVRILEEFYKDAGKEVPGWVSQFVPETQIEDVMLEQEQSIREFFEKLITETYRSSLTTYKNYTEQRTQVTFDKKLDFCLDNELIPFIRKKGWFVKILRGVMKELQKNGINHIHGLNDLANVIGGEFGMPKLDGTSTRLINIEIPKFVSFILPDIPDNPDVE